MRKVTTTQFIYSAVLGLSCMLLIGGWSIGYSGAREYINADSVKIADVKQGTFAQQVSGYGELQSLNKRLLTASQEAVVDQILLQPGSVVQPDSVIMTLKNPALEQKLQKALSVLQNQKLTRRKKDLEQQREMLSQESELMELGSRVDLANLQVEAQTPLVASGVISAMKFKRSKLEAEQLKSRHALERSKLEKLQEVHNEQLQIMDEEIRQSQAQFELAKKALSDMQIKAQIGGIVQRLPVSLGQSVRSGDLLALVGSVSPLVAKVKIPQLQASMVQSGATAEIDTRNGLVKGLVNRVNPVVENGAIEVEIQLVGELNSSIRPMQLVDAVIFGKAQENTVYVDKPAKVSAESMAQIFKLVNDHQAQKIPVRFGKTNKDVIEIVSGLSTGDRIIVSAVSVDDDTKFVQFTQ